MTYGTNFILNLSFAVDSSALCGIFGVFFFTYSYILNYSYIKRTTDIEYIKLISPACYQYICVNFHIKRI